MSCESMTSDFILFGATCCLRLQMKQKRSDRRAWTWFREEDLFWKQDDCRWSNHENWLSRIQEINVLVDVQNILRVMAMDLKISLERCLWSRSRYPDRVPVICEKSARSTLPVPCSLRASDLPDWDLGWIWNRTKDWNWSAIFKFTSLA